MKEKPLRLTISFGKKYEDVFHYLHTKENTSKFICELIRREMRNDSHEDEFEKKVHSTLLRLLKNENLALINEEKPVSVNESDSKLTEEEVEIMKNLFD